MKGICFIEPLHKATIQRTKTQTRRIIKDELSRSKPRYNVGEIVYLKEPYNDEDSQYRVLYKFDNDVKGDTKGFWQNKLFMPASAAQYFIKITDLRAERLQKISYEDCIKEGIFQHISHAKVYWKNGFDGLMYDSPRDAYAALINKINGKGTWDSNHYVWVYDYELTEKRTLGHLNRKNR